MSICDLANTEGKGGKHVVPLPSVWKKSPAVDWLFLTQAGVVQNTTQYFAMRNSDDFLVKKNETMFCQIKYLRCRDVRGHPFKRTLSIPPSVSVNRALTGRLTVDVQRPPTGNVEKNT